jgi:hypothetical protein
MFLSDKHFVMLHTGLYATLILPDFNQNCKEGTHVSVKNRLLLPIHHQNTINITLMLAKSILLHKCDCY